MARDSSLQLRKAILSHLRDDVAVTALVPAARIYGLYVPRNPTKPFIRYGVPTKLPDRASCMDGMRIGVTIHAFAKGKSEDAAANIGAALATSLDGGDGRGLVLILPTGFKATLTYTGGQTLPDPEEAGLWHEVVTADAVVVS